MSAMANSEKQRGVLALSVRGLSFSYPGCDPVFESFDLAVEEGAFCVLVGGTGSGKTTFLRNLKPEIAPTGSVSGAIELKGRSLSEFSVGESAARIGFVAQNVDSQLVCDTVWHEVAFGLENLGVPQENMRRRVAETATFFGIEPWMQRDTSSLSGGQKQLVNLASVLVMQPDVLLLDEPTAQLDPVAEKHFLHALFRINRELGVTVLVATHAPQTMVDYATDCAVIEGDPKRLHACDPSRFRGGMLDVERLRVSIGCSCSGENVRRRRVGGADAQAEIVGVRDVYFRYARAGEWVLRGVDASIEGGVRAIVGGNGSGKSTLLKTIAKVLKPERGRVSNNRLKGQALLPQDPKALFVCDTVEEELMEWSDACSYASVDMRKALERYDLVGLEQRHPYDLSGGQQQLLAMAKVMLTHPALLLLDEPTKGLDPQCCKRMADEIRLSAENGVAVVLVTHDLSFAAAVADSVTMLFDGQATCTDETAAFFAGNMFYRPQENGFTALLEVEGIVHENAGA